MFEWLFSIPKILRNTEVIIMNVSELKTLIGNLNTQLIKAKTEILGQLAALEEALKNQPIPADAQALLIDLGSTIQALDDIVADIPAE